MRDRGSNRFAMGRPFRRPALAVLLTCFVLAGCCCNGDENDNGDCESAPELPAVVPIAELPSAYDWRDVGGALPPVGDQGDAAVCIAWATSYATDFRIKRYACTGWDLSRPEQRLSPAYVHNLVLQHKAGSELGEVPSENGLIQFNQAFEMLTEFGVATEAWMPYTTDYLRHPVADAITNAADLRKYTHYVTSWAIVFTPSGNNWADIKSHIVNVGPVLFLMSAHLNFGCGVGRDYAGPAGTAYRGKHSLLCVGYDDEHEVGGAVVPSFLFMNSWGVSWGDDGFVWVPYDTMKKTPTGLTHQVYVTTRPSLPSEDPLPTAYQFPKEWEVKPSEELWDAEVYDLCGDDGGVTPDLAAPVTLMLPQGQDEIVLEGPALPLIAARIGGKVEFVDRSPPPQNGSYKIVPGGASEKTIGAWQESAVLRVVNRPMMPKELRIEIRVTDTSGKVSNVQQVKVRVD